MKKFSVRALLSSYIKPDAGLFLAVGVSIAFVSGCFNAQNVSVTSTDTASGVVSATGGFYSYSGLVAGTNARIGYADSDYYLSRFNHPSDVTYFGAYIYVADTDNHTIRKVAIGSGAVTTIAGQPGIPGYIDGPGSSSYFNGPGGIETDGVYLYVSDTINSVIRRIDLATNDVTTLVGMAAAPGYVNASGGAARVNTPRNLYLAGSNLLFSDSGNNCIRRVTLATAAVTDYAGQCITGTPAFADGTLVTATFYDPRGLTMVGSDLYVADYGNHVIRLVTGAAVSTFTGIAGSAGNNSGIPATTTFNHPIGLTNDGTYLYVTEFTNNWVRQIAIAGGFTYAYSGMLTAGYVNSTGPSTKFASPSGLKYYVPGNYLITADFGNHAIREVDITTSTVSTIAGSPDIVTGILDHANPRVARTGTPAGLAFAGDTLYFSDLNASRIRSVSLTTDAVTTVLGMAGAGHTNGTAVSAQFTNPKGLATDGTYLYISDSGNNLIRRWDIILDVVSDFSGDGTASSVDGSSASAAINAPTAMAIWNTSLYVFDSGGYLIRQISTIDGSMTTVSGNGINTITDGVSAATSSFMSVSGIATDGVSLFVTESTRHIIRKVDIATGATTTIAGMDNTPGSFDDVGPAARFNFPKGIATDGRYLFVADHLNSTIRHINLNTYYVGSMFEKQSSTSYDVEGPLATALIGLPVQVLHVAGLGLFVTNDSSIRYIE